ncbi:hypothetical protein [Alkalicoccus chagannorensis]|uniref:hypothetical protein n=1 Tax=Alkalicoccus chagannorensis TaxID=427072 RepID=UPI00040F640E|nr:hypothetical protein [Alkalicoccus chagannorensis]
MLDRIFFTFMLIVLSTYLFYHAETASAPWFASSLYAQSLFTGLAVIWFTALPSFLAYAAAAGAGILIVYHPFSDGHAGAAAVQLLFLFLLIYTFYRRDLTAAAQR